MAPGKPSWPQELSSGGLGGSMSLGGHSRTWQLTGCVGPQCRPQLLGDLKRTDGAHC